MPKTKIKLDELAAKPSNVPAAPAPTGLPADGRVRAVIDAVLPVVDGGRFPVKRIVGTRIKITAHCFADGHDALRVMLQWSAPATSMSASTAPVPQRHEVPMVAVGNDVWEAEFTPPLPGRYVYTVAAWVDPFDSWRHELIRRVDVDDIRVAVQLGAIEVAAAASRAKGAERKVLTDWATALRRGATVKPVKPAKPVKPDGATDARSRVADGAMPTPEVDLAVSSATLKALALDEEMAAIVARYPDRRFEARHQELPLTVERERAGFSSWYELFPRSASSEPGVHGTFRDVEARLPAIAQMGFDVLYFPPIHPIGRVNRKGRNNALVTQPGDVGSPWAIGAEEGGHKAILPELGTAAEFRHLVAAAAGMGLEVALDIAFQCAPDHPYVLAHPDWFRWRPDGTVQYAENPPKKYQDIYPFNFESGDWRAMWAELKSVFDHWIGEGVKIFRVDNPHTKAFAFWEWTITQVQLEHPDVIFLAEAFTRPKVMHRLAKLGFSQSYTYYTWRNTKQDLIAYFTELSQGPGLDYFRPNVWPNTPDILHEQLQGGEPSVYMARLVLAATLSASYGVYGPAYELIDHRPRGTGSEEYLDSEKYQLRHWTHESPNSLAAFIGRVNRIRREHGALQSNESLRFLPVDNDQMLAYAKSSPDGTDVIVTVVNIDPFNVQSGWIELDPATIGIADGGAFQMHDLISNQRFLWQGQRHYVRLDPHVVPAHVFAVRRRLRDEHDFEYFL